MQNHLSINLAAEMLERTRRTIKRALRHVPPDSHERGQPRWKLPKIIEALASSGAPMIQPHYAENRDQLADQCDAAFAQFDRQFAEMKAASTLVQRRKMSIELAPLIAQTIKLMKARDTANGLHTDHVALRIDRMFSLLMVGFEEPCKWTREDTWRHLDITGANDPDVS